MVKRLAAVGAVVCAVLAFPARTEAGLADFIWGLSGPQMLGFGAGCRWTLDSKADVDVCEVGASPTKALRVGASQADPRAPFFFSVGGTFYVSTPWGPSSPDYGWADVLMGAFEPGVSFRSLSRQRTPRERRIELYHGVGPVVDIAFSNPFKDRDFGTFAKFGVKLTPVEVLFHRQRIAVALNARYYPDRFTDDEFLPGRLEYDRPSEWAFGFSVGILTKRK